MQERVEQALQRLRAPRVRAAATALAALVFIVGGIWSVSSLNLTAADTDPVMLLLLLALAPLGLAYTSINMMLMGKAVGVHLPFQTGFTVSAWATIAELLPLPGGAIVRAGALMRQGGAAGESTALVLAFAVLWIGCAALGASLALSAEGTAIALLVGCGGSACIIAASSWIGIRHTWRIAIAAIALRLVGLSLVALRLGVAFATIRTMVSGPDAMLFALANILGSAAAIAPGGLGISEGLAAGFATQSVVLPAAAFLAVGLNRIAGLFAAGLVALIMSRPASEPSTVNV